MGFRDLVVKTLLGDKNPNKAILMIMERYPDPMKSCIAVYSLWSRIRIYIASKEENRNKYYNDRITNLLYSIPPSSVDHEMVKRLSESSISQQHRVQSSSRRYLVDPDIDLKLKAIKVIKAPFYLFNLPQQIILERKRVLMERARADQRHERKARSYYNISKEETDRIIKAALDYIKSPIKIKQKKDVCILINACQILSGRRNYEICKSLEYEAADHPMQAKVRGICKKDKLRAEGREDYTIPLLCTYWDWKLAMDLLRYHTKSMPDSPALLNSSLGNKVLEYSDRLFGRKLTHTQKRNIYAEVAYANRETDNLFLVNDKSCSKLVWISRALCHSDPGTPSVTQRYQTMQVGS